MSWENLGISSINMSKANHAQLKQALEGISMKSELQGINSYSYFRRLGDYIARVRTSSSFSSRFFVDNCSLNLCGFQTSKGPSRDWKLVSVSHVKTAIIWIAVQLALTVLKNWQDGVLLGNYCKRCKGQKIKEKILFRKNEQNL